MERDDDRSETWRQDADEVEEEEEEEGEGESEQQTGPGQQVVTVAAERAATDAAGKCGSPPDVIRSELELAAASPDE